MFSKEPQLSNSQKELAEKSKIFSGKMKPLSNYQQAINKAAFELCEGDQSLLLNRDKLFKESREKVKADGYTFAKGKSRANVVDEPKKRAMTTNDQRAEFIELLNQEILAKQNQIRFKEHRVEKAKTSKSWEMCDTLTGEVSKLRKEVFEAQQQIKQLQRKQSQSLWYKKQKTQSKNEKKKQSDTKEAEVVIDAVDNAMSNNVKDSATNTPVRPIHSFFNHPKDKEVPAEKKDTTSSHGCATNFPDSESIIVTSNSKDIDIPTLDCGQKENDFHFL